MSKKSFLTQSWRKLSITLKLTVAFTALLLLIVLTTLTSYLALTTVRQQAETMLTISLQDAPLESDKAEYQAQLEQAYQQINQSKQLAMNVLVITLISATILVLIIALLLHKNITHNIVKLNKAAIELQQGNLDIRVEVDSQDELGQLATTLNLLTQHIIDLVDDLETETEEAHNRLIKTIESISEGFSLYDAQDRLRLFNHKYREFFGDMAITLKTGNKFKNIIRAAAEQEHYVDAIARIDAWIEERIAYHRHPQGVFEEQLADGRWIQTNEYKTDDNEIFGIHTDITAYKEAEAVLRRQNEYLEVSHEVTIDLLGHLDLNELLEDIINRAGNLLETQHGYIYLVEPNFNEIERKIGVGLFSNKSLGFRLKPGEGVAGKVWHSGQALLVNDLKNWEGWSAQVDYDDIYSIAGVPLKSGQLVVGVIGMAFDTQSGKHFEADEVELLSRFAQLASIALDNARLYTTAQEEKKRSDNLLNVVIPLGVALSAEQNFDRLLEKILSEAKSFCNADAGSLYLRTEDDYLKFVIIQNDSLNVEMGGPNGQPISFPPIPLYDPVTGQPNHNSVAAYATLTGNAVNIPDAYEAEGFNFSSTKEFDENSGYYSTSFLTIPLKNAHNYVVGILQLINAQAQGTGRIIPFSRSLEQTTGTLSSLATVALEAYIREQNLRQQIQQLKIEIDQVKHQKQVDAIVETDFFQDLQIKVRNIRRRSGRSKTQQNQQAPETDE